MSSTVNRIKMTDTTMELLQTFYFNAFDGIFITDKDGKVLLVNPAMLDMLDTSYDELVGVYIDIILKKGIYTNSASMKVIETNKPFTGITLSKNGVEIMSTSIPVFDDKNELKYIITNCRPLSIITDFYKKYSSPITGKLANSDIFPPGSNKCEIIYKSESMRKIMEKVQIVSKTDCTVMIYGETGTGKSLLAQYIHLNSLRHKGRLVEINCATIPDNLIESELFGYERGAFTGANTQGKLGLFEVADGGTIFLDEIAEIPLHLQAKLLKVLDLGYLRRVGGTVDHKINVRIIGATNVDLKKLVREKKFREDLYYRLNVFPLHMPPLKDRKLDIPPLSEKTIENLNEKYNLHKKINKQLSIYLQQFDWPGNIRQLRNTLERLYISCFADELTIDNIEKFHEDSDIYFDSQGDTVSNDLSQGDLTLSDYLYEAEKAYIQQKLEECRGSVANAAKKLDLHRTTLYKKISDYQKAE